MLYETIYPNTVAVGDNIAVAHDRQGRPTKWSKVKTTSVNPRGCKGKTHIDGGCYDNIAKLDVQRG